MVLPDRWIDHASQQEQYDAAGLSTGHVVSTVLKVRGEKRVFTDPIVRGADRRTSLQVTERDGSLSPRDGSLSPRELAKLMGDAIDS